MKLNIADKFKALLVADDSDRSAKEPKLYVATVVAVTNDATLISGVDGCQIPVVIGLTDGESDVAVGEVLRFQEHTGIVEKRESVKATPTARVRRGTGSPDRSMKSNGF